MESTLKTGSEGYPTSCVWVEWLRLKHRPSSEKGMESDGPLTGPPPDDHSTSQDQSPSDSAAPTSCHVCWLDPAMVEFPHRSSHWSLQSTS